MRKLIIIGALGWVLTGACAHAHVVPPLSSCSPATSEPSGRAPTITSTPENACNHVVVFSVAWGGERKASEPARKR